MQIKKLTRRELRTKKKQDAEKSTSCSVLPAMELSSSPSLPENPPSVQTDAHPSVASVSDDLLSTSLHSLLATSPSLNEKNSTLVTMPSDIKQNFDECLQLYDHGLPYLIQHPEQLDRLTALSLSLADQTCIPPASQCFVETLSSHLSSFKLRQQSLNAELYSLNQHFSMVDQIKKSIPEVMTPITEVTHEDKILGDQELALQQRILTLKEEFTAAEAALSQASGRRLLLQDQLEAKRNEGLKLQDRLSQLYKVHPLMKRKKKVADNAQANLVAEWNQLKDLLS